MSASIVLHSAQTLAFCVPRSDVCVCFAMVKVVWAPAHGACPPDGQDCSEAETYFMPDSIAPGRNRCVSATSQLAHDVAIALTARVNYTTTGPPKPGTLYVGTSADICFLPSPLGARPTPFRCWCYVRCVLRIVMISRGRGWPAQHCNNFEQSMLMCLGLDSHPDEDFSIILFIFPLLWFCPGHPRTEDTSINSSKLHQVAPTTQKPQRSVFNMVAAQIHSVG